MQKCRISLSYKSHEFLVSVISYPQYMTHTATISLENYLGDYLSIGGACGVMVIVIGNGHERHEFKS